MGEKTLSGREGVEEGERETGKKGSKEKIKGEEY